MNRVSTDMANYDMQYHLKTRSKAMNDLENKIASQTRLNELRDDPVAAAHAGRYQSYLQRLDRYSDNVSGVIQDNQITEGYMNSANDILMRIRELTVQGATDTFSHDDKQHMAAEVDQLLNQLVEIGNARTADGKYLFSGTRTDTPPFRVMETVRDGQKVISDVAYIGNIQERRVEISENSFVNANYPGNTVFWAEKQQARSSVDASAYTVTEDSTVMIDGEMIELKTGDNINAVVNRINHSAAAVKASIDPVNNSLVFSTTDVHQLWLEDSGESSVFRDLGLISDTTPPHNLRNASGGSLFDMVIKVRDSLMEGDTIDIGGGALKGLDNAQSNLLTAISDLGSKNSRLATVQDRLIYEIPEVSAKLSRETDIDITEAITNLKMLEYTHTAALQTAAKIIQPTLLDFLR